MQTQSSPSSRDAGNPVGTGDAPVRSDGTDPQLVPPQSLSPVPMYLFLPGLAPPLPMAGRQRGKSQTSALRPPPRCWMCPDAK